MTIVISGNVERHLKTYILPLQKLHHKENWPALYCNCTTSYKFTPNILLWSPLNIKCNNLHTDFYKCLIKRKQKDDVFEQLLNSKISLSQPGLEGIAFHSGKKFFLTISPPFLLSLHQSDDPTIKRKEKSKKNEEEKTKKKKKENQIVFFWKR